MAALEASLERAGGSASGGEPDDADGTADETADAPPKRKRASRARKSA
jgi:hypothetical protein